MDLTKKNQKDLRMMQLFVICMQESMDMKEMWAMETRDTVMLKEICYISNSLCDKILSFVLLS